MSREIKFRAWDKKNKIMIPDVPNKSPILEFVNAGTKNQDSIIVGYEINPDLILMQYTGLKDKNGKKIWEGDIVKSKQNLLYIINYEYDSFCAGYVENNIIWLNRAINYFPKFNFKVIGNIYENPELLNGGQNV